MTKQREKKKKVKRDFPKRGKIIVFFFFEKKRIQFWINKLLSFFALNRYWNVVYRNFVISFFFFF